MAGGSRTRRTGMAPLTVGLISFVVVSCFVYLGFTKDIPLIGKPFELKATFESANSIRLNSPVRIAGVNVGKVTKVEPQDGGNGAVMTLSIKKQGLPIHEDATAKIRPRIFLEGNFFVDLKPGSPAAPVLEQGDMIKVTQTSTPVQLDQILSTLNDDTREDLKATLDGLAIAFTGRPTPEQDAQADPDTVGETGAESFNDTYDDSPEALRSAAIVNEAMLGLEPDKDIARLIDGGAKTTEALARDEGALKDLITNFNRTTAAFASEEANLRATIRLLGPTLDAANRAFASLNAAFPATRAFSREILPGVRETPATIDASFPWIEQARRLVSVPELRGLARDLSPATADLARLTDRLRDVLPEADLIARCATEIVLPTGDIKIKDEFDNGVENYKEFIYALVGLSSEGANFDGNGSYVRFQVGGGPNTVTTGDLAGGPLLYNTVAAPLGTRPAFPRKRPPYVADKACHTQTPPDLMGIAARKGGTQTALRDDKTVAAVARRARRAGK